MKVRKLISILSIVAGIAGSSLIAAESYAATQKPVALPGDRRMKTFTYQPNTVFEYTGYLKVASRIDLDPSEEILSITMGDPTGWQMNPVGHRLYLKPVEVEAETNMVILTTKRIYYFIVNSKEYEKLDDSDMVFAVTFNYTDAGNTIDNKGFMDFTSKVKTKEYMTEKQKQKNMASLNYSYTINGSKSIQPLEVHDDGEFTYFKFRDINAEVPAIFQVLPDGNEALINFRVENGYVVVEMVTSQFTLRLGNQIACIFNEKMPLETTAPPKIKQKRTGDDDPWYKFW